MKIYYSLFVLLYTSSLVFAQVDDHESNSGEQAEIPDIIDQRRQSINLLFPQQRLSHTNQFGFQVQRAGTFFEITITSPESQLIHWRIFDLNGRFTKMGKQSLLEGANFFDIESSNLVRGIYIIEVRIQEEILHKKVMVW